MNRKIIKKFVEDLKTAIIAQNENVCNADVYSAFNKFVAEIYISANSYQELLSFFREILPTVFCNSINIDATDINIPVEEFKDIEIFDLFFQYYNFDNSGYYKMTQFYTPHNIAKDIVAEILTKDIKYVLDPACGSGVFLREIYNRASALNIKPEIIAYETDERAIQLAKISYAINAFEKNGKKEYIDIINNDFLLDSGCKKNDCVVANPPFVGRKNMPKQYMAYLTKNYPLAKENIAYGFLLKVLDVLNEDKNAIFIIPDNFLYLYNTKKFKEHILSNYIVNIQKLDTKEFKDIKGSKLSTCILNINKKTPVKNSLSEKKYNILSDVATIVTGIQTGDNCKYVKHFSEIKKSDMATGVNQKGKKWYPYLKGGGYKKWSGNDGYYVFFENNGQELRKNKKAIIRNEKYFDEEGITYSYYSENRFSARYKEKGTLFDIGGSCMFFDNSENLYYTLAFLNSGVCCILLKKINPTMSFQTSSLKVLPFQKSNEKEIIKLSKKVVNLSQKADKFFINSKYFKKPDFIKNKSSSFRKDFMASEEKYHKIKREIKKIENQINSEFEKIYDIHNPEYYSPKEKNEKYYRKSMINSFLKWLNIKNYNEFFNYMKSHYPNTFETDIEFITRILNGKHFKKQKEIIETALTKN